MPEEGRVIGLDLGERRIGVAVCDGNRTVATPLETVTRVGDRVVEHAVIAELVADNDVTAVVVGLPLALDGSVGPAARKVLSEVKRLRTRLGVPVVTHDERLSTVEGERSLRAQGVRGRDRRNVIDQLAASVILQSWIDADLNGRT